MKITIESQKNIINNNNIKNILDKYQNMKVFYIDLQKQESRYYIWKDIFWIDMNQFVKLLSDIFLINNIILKKTVFHIVKNDIDCLHQLWFTDDMISVVRYIFSKINPISYKDLPLSYFGRYDIIIWEDDTLHIVEINSETPAWLPESSNTDIIFDEVYVKNLIDTNKELEQNLYKSIFPKLEEIKKSDKKNFLVCFWDDHNEFGDGEDMINTLYMTDFFVRNLPDKIVKMWNIADCETKSDWIYFEWQKQDFLYSFYPMEWYFTDRWGDTFWSAYMSWNFEIINNPLNLITQSKAFWPYLFETIQKQENWDIGQIFSPKEIQVIKEYIPKYYFQKPSFFSFKKTINKPLFYREWVGIWDSSFIWKQVYQDFIKQKKINFDTFEWMKQWYLTIWLYFGENWYIWTYNRFCENKITDHSAYFVPMYVF